MTSTLTQFAHAVTQLLLIRWRHPHLFPLVRMLHVNSLPCLFFTSLHSWQIWLFTCERKAVSFTQWMWLYWQVNKAETKDDCWKAVTMDKKNVCVFIVYAIRCEWFPRKTLFLPVYIGSLFQFWLQRISNQHVFSTAFFFVLVFWVIIFFSKRCTETLFLSSCHCGICLLKRTRWALRVVACDFHK